MKQTFVNTQRVERFDPRPYLERMNRYGWICPSSWDEAQIRRALRQLGENISAYAIRPCNARQSTTLWIKSVLNRMPSGEIAPIRLVSVDERDGHVIGSYASSPMSTMIMVNESSLWPLERASPPTSARI